MSKQMSKKRSTGRRLAGVTMPVSRKRMKWGRNWLCLCGSGKKYKTCCMKDIDSLTLSDGNAVEKEIPSDIQEMIKEYQESLLKEKDDEQTDE